MRFAALSYRDFRLFWFGQIVSLSGTWMQSVAQGWLVYDLTKSPLYLGIVAAAGSFPILLFSLIGGIVADRLRKRDLLLITQASSMIPALLLGLFIDIQIINVWFVILSATLLGMINAFDIPARQSFLVELVGKENLTNAIALNSAAFHGSRMIGPVVAGFTISYLGLSACFYINALSFFAVLIALSRIKARGEVTKGGSFKTDLYEGLEFVKGNSMIFNLMFLIAIFSLIGMPFITLLPVFAGEIFKNGVQGFSLLVSATGIGAFTSAVSIAYKKDIENKYSFIMLSAFLFSIVLLLFSLSQVFLVSLCLLAVAGWSLVSLLAIANSYIQHAVPDRLRGRVMSVYTLVFLGATPIGNSMVGTVADYIGTVRTIMFSSIACLLVSILFVFRKEH
jgi:MFS family permease